MIHHRSTGFALAALVVVLAACTPSTYASGPQLSKAPSAAGEVVATPAAAAVAPVAAGPASSVGDGTYQVGTDLVAGRYKSAGPDKSSAFPFCYWARSKDDSGETSAIIANDNLRGPGSVTVRKGEFFTASGGCTWTKV